MYPCDYTTGAYCANISLSDLAGAIAFRYISKTCICTPVQRDHQGSLPPKKMLMLVSKYITTNNKKQKMFELTKSQMEEECLS